MNHEASVVRLDAPYFLVDSEKYAFDACRLAIVRSGGYNELSMFEPDGGTFCEIFKMLPSKQKE